jgi:hypothetical protein
MPSTPKIKRIEVKIITDSGTEVASTWIHPQFRRQRASLRVGRGTIMFKESETDPAKWFGSMVEKTMVTDSSPLEKGKLERG